ncbi:LOW QUALITY PROTEIN: uncharacterized protein EMH_0012850 [Eimeria mitis]|uniref:Uncharacterized protein n=1 Tax=Eimeria mitis TaxID=44415 RepID=U6K495_9EIME|nr:LOW QUALITY PROTEIN: uncharacterized protein EMH_0012850 [Eimeria mitis]CDJ32545.1 hypothetical protein, conserved [Eimeria mitis]
MGIVASLESASETTKNQFAAEYMFVPEGTRGVRTVFEYFARLINGVRSVAPPSDAEPEAVAAHKVRSAFLIALLDATSERLRGIDERSSMVPEFWEYSAPLDEDAKTKIPYLPSSKDDRQSSGESSDVPASADAGAATEDGVQFSVFLKRLNTHVEDLSDQISEAEEKEAKSKVPADVKRELALRFADLLGAARTRLEEDSERREGDGESIYGETGASAYAGELARRAQTQTECVLEEATRYLVDLEAELSNERQSGYHDRSFVNEVADYWKGAEVEKAWKSITEEEREKRAVAQRIKLSALRAVQDAVQECASRKEYVDALLLQAAIALL